MYKILVFYNLSAQSELYASGDHYILYSTLVKMGFRPEGDAMAVYDMAGEVLAGVNLGCL